MSLPRTKEFYAASSADVKLLPTNVYARQVDGICSTDSSTMSSPSRTKKVIKFEEMELGTTFSALRHLVVSTVTASVARSAGSTSLSLAKVELGPAPERLASDPVAIREDNGKFMSTSTNTSASSSSIDVLLEKRAPQWETRKWFDNTLVVEGFCPDMVRQSANSLNDMMVADENIKLGVIQLTIHARSKPFAKGSIRLASYARTANSTSKFVVKSFQKDDKGLFDVTEDMRIQALCKAFALEFNGLLNIEPPIDFIITTCLQIKGKSGMNDGCLSLEPFIDGAYVKYNNNGLYVKEDPPDEPDLFNQIAQAFSHFTFERSWGEFLVNDLQGVGHLLTDPSIQTKDPERFNLADTNLHGEGFKYFFAAHKCNRFCHKLELKTKGEMLISGEYEFRERWPTLEPTVSCSNKLCRKVIRPDSTHESDKFPGGHHWCAACFSQLQASTVRLTCLEPSSPDHDFETSKFFHESQGQLVPQRCPDHTEKDKTLSSAAVVGGSLWDRMKAEGSKQSISGRTW